MSDEVEAVDAIPTASVRSGLAREVVVAVLLALAGVMIALGAEAAWHPAGLIIGGVLLVAWTIAVFGDLL